VGTLRFADPDALIRPGPRALRGMWAKGALFRAVPTFAVACLMPGAAWHSGGRSGSGLNLGFPGI